MSSRIRYWCMFRIRSDMAYIPVAFYRHNSRLDSCSSIFLQKQIVQCDMLCTAFPMNHCTSNTMSDTMHSYTRRRKRWNDEKWMRWRTSRNNNKSNSVRNKLNCGFYYEIYEMFHEHVCTMEICEIARWLDTDECTHWAESARTPILVAQPLLLRLLDPCLETITLFQ